MKEKQKLKNTPDDILIAKRHIEFVTEYSVDTCIKNLQNLEKDDSRWIKVETSRFGRGSTSAHFSVMFYKKSKDIYGTLTPQKDGSTLIEAKIPPNHWENRGFC